MPTTVLVVDDDRILVEVLNLMLKREGFQARLAYNGAQGLKILTSERIDIVVLDVMLPDMNGFEICKQIRSLPKIGDIPVLMLSARTQVADRVAGFEAGADDYVAKPVVLKEIVARIRTLLARSQRARGGPQAVVALVGTKGGVGNSTVALNLAASLVTPRRRVILVELGGSGSSGAWMLGLQATTTLAGLVKEDEFGLSMSDLQKGILAHSSGLHYIAGHSIEIGTSYAGGLLAETITLLQLVYDVVVIDLSMSTWGILEILGHASVIVPVAQYDDNSIHYLSALLGWLSKNNLSGKPSGIVLVERSQEPKATSPSAICERTGLPLWGVIPPAPDLIGQAHNQHQPAYVVGPTDALSLAISQLGQHIMDIPPEG